MDTSLVAAAYNASISATADDQRREVIDIDFLGEATFPTGLIFESTQVGGLSGLTYDGGIGPLLRDLG